jgi:hypothetical protein
VQKLPAPLSRIEAELPRVLMSKTTSSLWSGLRTPLLLGVAGCAACCAVPLTAAVVGAGAAATAALVLEPFAALLTTSGVVLAVGAYARHRRATTSCATTGTCVVDRS